MQTIAVEAVAPAEIRSDHFLTMGALSIMLVTGVLAAFSILVMAWVSPFVGDPALIFAGLVGLIDALFVTPMRMRIDGRNIEVHTVGRARIYDSYALIARRVPGSGYSLARKTRPHRSIAWVRSRDLAALGAAGVDVA
jgi:hypothetical protein